MSYGRATRTSHELGAYDAGYRLGRKAWTEAEPDIQDGEPPEHLTEGFGAMQRDGFRDGWGDAMVEG